MKNNPFHPNLVDGTLDFETRSLSCHGCSNNCNITRFKFNNGKVFFSGNKCEKIFSNKGDGTIKGFDFTAFKYDLLFNRPLFLNKSKQLIIGIPRVMNLYEEYPFWNKLFTECGFEIKLSEESTLPLGSKGFSTVMSDSICFPAKITNGHILNLIQQGVNRIFYPKVYFEKNEYRNAENSFMCPIVSSYPEVIRSAVNPQEKYGIPLDSPNINFNNRKLLKQQLWNYLKQFKVSKAEFKLAYDKAWAEMDNFHQTLVEKGKEVIDNAKANHSLLIVLAGRPYHIDPLINHKTPDTLTSLGVDVITEDAIEHEFNTEEIQVITQWAYPNRILNAAQWVALQKPNIQFVQMNSFGCGPDAILVDECKAVLKTANKPHTLIRVDEITSTGSIRLRLRSLIESLKLNQNKGYYQQKVREKVKIFEHEDKQRIILAPYFGEFYSDLVPFLFEAAGYRLINLPKPDKDSVENGLKYANNEICYPATIIVGDVIKALKSGKYDRGEVAIGITQTGGQCRASTYLSLIRKAMISAGYADIPVISIGTSGKVLNSQPGFEINWLSILPVTIVGILYADALAILYHHYIVREKEKGRVAKLKEEYIARARLAIAKKRTKDLFQLLSEAVCDFQDLELIDDERAIPKVAIVGEIYVKFNTFGHSHISEWLVEQGVEVIFPPLLEFFTQEFINIRINQKENLSDKKMNTNLFLYFIEKYTQQFIRRTNHILKPTGLQFHDIHKMAEKASEIIDLSVQFGEGWLIPAEIAAFAKAGIHHVISVQPFGCIANQIISKGVEKKIRQLHPKMNLLFLDFDDGASDVNILNRLHFMLNNIKEEAHLEIEAHL
jgi:predicted nucleotide-binding protein (sugar kinase/HSP70/actin superfamily)